jgi:hypothetical protein
MKITVLSVKEAPGCIHVEMILHSDNGKEETGEVFIDMWEYPGRWTHKHPSDSNAMVISNEKIIEDVFRAVFQYRDRVLDNIKSITDITSKYLSKDPQ